MKCRALYSGCFGLGSRDLQPEGLIGAIENMLPKAPEKAPFYYLSVDVLHAAARPRRRTAAAGRSQAAYPRYPHELAVRGSENPNLMPPGAITVRMHSIGGWGAITTGKNLAMTLFDLLNYDIKANPKYGSEKKGQPTTYYLSAAPEPIRVNCEYVSTWTWCCHPTRRCSTPFQRAHRAEKRRCLHHPEQPG
jgi:pyruvate-ferredoxin/flavodoxin oxidoreductase